MALVSADARPRLPKKRRMEKKIDSPYEPLFPVSFLLNVRNTGDAFHGNTLAFEGNTPLSNQSSQRYCEVTDNPNHINNAIMPVHH